MGSTERKMGIKRETLYEKWDNTAKQSKKKIIYWSFHRHRLQKQALTLPPVCAAIKWIV